MLNRTLAPLRAASWSWAHVCVLLVGLMWLLPFLHFRHETPLTTYDQEWWSAALGLAAMTLLLGWRFWQQPSVPRITLVPLLMVVVVLLQVGLGKVVYFEQGLLYILYLLFAMLLMMLGAHLRANFGIERLALALAVFLIVGAELNAVAGFIQHYRWNTPFNPYVVGKINASVYGNLAQPNQFSDYLTLGLISIGLLYQQRKLPLLALPLLATPLLFAIALSGSRSPWLFFFSMILLAWFWARRDQDMRRLLFFGLSILAGHTAMIFIVQLPFLAGADSMDMSRRMFQDHASWMVRIYLWKESFNIFLTAPWLGVGFGQYAIHHFQWVPILRPESSHIVGMYNHAHNLVLQLAAESGVLGLSIFLAGVLLWLRGIFQARCTAAHWWGYSILMVLAIHSMLEYPLWYFYFLGVLAVLMGMLDETRYELELRQLGRVGVALILLLGGMSLYQVDSDYHRLKRTLAAPGNTLEARQKLIQGLLDIRRGSLMYPQALLTLSVFREAKRDEYLKQKLLLNTEAIRFMPLPMVATQQAILLALDDQPDAAKRVLQQIAWSYPDEAGGYQRLLDWAEKDPARFEPLVEYIDQQEEERASGIHR